MDEIMNIITEETAVEETAAPENEMIVAPSPEVVTEDRTINPVVAGAAVLAAGGITYAATRIIKKARLRKQADGDSHVTLKERINAFRNPRPVPETTPENDADSEECINDPGIE